MSWLSVLGALVQLFLPIIKLWLEKNSVKRKEQQDAIDKVVEGIKNGDSSAVSIGLDALNRRVR